MWPIVSLYTGSYTFLSSNTLQLIGRELGILKPLEMIFVFWFSLKKLYLKIFGAQLEYIEMSVSHMWKIGKHEGKKKPPNIHYS